MTDTIMYFSVGIKVKSNWKFRMTHQEEPVEASEMVKIIPDFAASMDCKPEWAGLAEYYRFDEDTGIYELIDNAAGHTMHRAYERATIPEEEDDSYAKHCARLESDVIPEGEDPATTEHYKTLRLASEYYESLERATRN